MRTIRMALLPLAAMACVMISLTGRGCAADTRRTLLAVQGTPLRTGAFSPFANLQDALAERLKSCGRDASAADVAVERQAGLYGTATTAGLLAAHECGVTDEDGRALTAGVWHSLMGTMPVPGLQERVDALILTFEATDFGQPPEWNICQDGFQQRAGEQMPICVNHSDPCSFLTWGPRGATAGQGREIQWILSRLLRSDPELLTAAFGNEFDNVKRFTVLAAPPVEDCDGTTPLEHFMCALWLDPSRRGTWTSALTQLGRRQAARAAFQSVYALDAFDGFKIRAYYELWKELDLSTSEIDYAFFLDRATQIGAPPEAIALSMRECIGWQTAALNRNAAARRCLSALHPHPTLPADRLARDVSFYSEGFAAGSLSAREVSRWQNHIPILANANFGLSDTRPALADLLLPRASVAESAGPTFNSVELTETERACPVSILKPARPVATRR